MIKERINKIGFIIALSFGIIPFIIFFVVNRLYLKKNSYEKKGEDIKK